MILDCQNMQSTIESVSSYYGQDTDTIYNILKDTDFDLLFLKYAYRYDYFSDFLFNYFSNKFGINTIHKVMWFHLTRSLNPDSYKNGIMPLDKILPQLQSDLYQIVKKRISKSEWCNIYKYGSGGSPKWRYREKISNKIHFGPYAMLVREIAFHSKEAGNHDYLQIPEIVEDISRGMIERFGIDLVQEYSDLSKSVIVKFQRELDSQDRCEHYIGAALCYLYSKLHKQKLSLVCNTCFSGYGIIIPPKDVVAIEIIE